MQIYKKNFKWTQITIDRMGRTFTDDQFFYRGIYNYKSQIRRVEKMFSSGLIDLLIKKEFILPIEMTDLEFADTTEFGLILRSKKIKNIMYPTEWSYSMLLDAAKFMIRLEKVLLQNGYTLHDYHPFNLFFAGCKVYHCDLGSIVRVQGNSEEKFCMGMVEKFFRPLIQWSKEGNSVAKVYISGSDGISGLEWKRYLYGKWWGEKLVHIQNVLNIKKKMSLSTLENNFDKLAECSNNVLGSWSHYQDEFFGEDGKIKSNPRLEAVGRLIKKYNIETITELAANQGVFSQYCLETGSVRYSLAIDYDESAVDTMYQRLRDSDLKDKISVGVVDLVNMQFTNLFNFKNRMKNQAVLALALIHHLILSQGMSVESALDIISEFAEQYVFVEFMPLGLYSTSRGFDLKKFPLDYTLENFRTILNKKCEILEEINLEANRVLFVAEKRNNGEK